MSRVLVTCGAGYIGSHAVKALRRAGHEVVVIDNLVAGHRDALPDVPLVEADIADTETVRETIRRYDVSSVMHFAALLSVGESVSRPSRYYRVNVGGALSVLDAMVSESVDHLVFSSTCAIFGHAVETPIPEDHPTCPCYQSAYEHVLREMVSGTSQSCSSAPRTKAQKILCLSVASYSPGHASA